MVASAEDSHKIHHVISYLSSLPVAVLTTNSENCGDTAVLHCSGRIVRGTKAILCAAATSQCEKDTIVLDLSDVRAVDAAGLGVFALLGWWAGAQQIELLL